MPDLELSITICSWNTADDLRACLSSLAAVAHEVAFEVIVVDNNSVDVSPDMVENEFPWVRLVRSAVNLGFTGGQNHALTIRKAPNALVLNSDTIVHPGALAKLMEFQRAHPEIGVIGPKLLNTDGSLQFSCRRFPNPVAALFRNTVFGRLFPNNRFTREYLMTDLPHDSVSEVDWVSGAAMVVSEEFLNRVGLLDPEYFMFCEDVDWCFRAWKSGLKVVYYPEALITHAVGKSTDKAPNRMIGGFHRSMYRFYSKNMVPQLPKFWQPWMRVFAASALLARASMFIVKNKFDNLWR